MTWKKLTERYLCEWNLNEVDPCDRLPGREPTDVDDAPASAC